MKIKLEDKVHEIDRDKYIKAKTKQLKEFGYSSLTEQEVSDQIDLIQFIQARAEVMK